MTKQIDFVSLNADLKVLDDELAVDLMTRDTGAYCGSFTVSAKEARRICFAINSAGSLLIEGRQPNHISIFAKIRREKGYEQCINPERCELKGTECNGSCQLNVEEDDINNL